MYQANCVIDTVGNDALRVLLALLLCVVAHAPGAAQVMLQLQPGSAASTVAGSGADGGATPGSAVASALGSPRGVAYDSGGNLLVADARNHVVVKISVAGVLSVVAGTGRQGYAGDGGLATAAAFNEPSAVVVDAAGNLYIADTGNHCIRRVSAAGVVSTIAGSGSAGNAGDGGVATAALLRRPGGLAMDAVGNLFIADTGNHRVREVRTDGTMVAFAGSGVEGNSGDGGAGLAATLQAPVGLAFTASGGLLIADSSARRVRLVSAGVISAYAATTRRPEGVAVDASGSAYIADAGNQLVLQSDADGASNAAGSGGQGLFVSGAPTASPLDSPAAVAVGSNGDLIVADRRNHQVQRVSLEKLEFGSVAAGTMSLAQGVTLRNTGTEPLQVLAVSVPAAFTAVSAGATCVAAPFLLQAAAQCVVEVAFAPVGLGAQSGIAQVRVMGAAPQSVLLVGTGVTAGTVAVSVTALTSNGSVSYAGAPVTFVATVTGALGGAPTGTVSLYDGTVLVTTAALSGGTAQIATASLMQGSHVLYVVYSGNAVYGGSTSGTVTETVVAAPDFTVAGAAGSYSGSAGAAIAVGITLTPMNGTLNHAVTFSVTGLPTGATAVFLPVTVVLGGNPVPVTLTAQMPATLSYWRRPMWPVLAGSLLASMALVSRRRVVPLFCLALLAMVCAGGCGGGFRGGANSSGSSGGGSGSGVFNYNAVVTATTTGVLGDVLTHSVTIGLVVTQ